MVTSIQVIFNVRNKKEKGRFTFSNGGYYDGSWVQGKYEGFGGTSTVDMPSLLR
jgi:hypothetical protein